MFPEFLWDARKERANRAKHRVSFEEAITVFSNPAAQIFDDEEHSNSEPREVIIGHSTASRLLVVCFVETGGQVRLISARKATRMERLNYEENV